MLHSLKKEMNYFTKSVQNAIWVAAKRRLAKIVYFGSQKVEVVAQAYQGKNNPLPVSELLSRILFGGNYSKIERYTIYQTGRLAIFAIQSLDQTKNIFTIADDYATELFIKNNVDNNNNNNNRVQYSAAGEILIQGIAPSHL